MTADFGWSYPAGCNSVPGDEDPGPCPVCDEFLENCTCPTCPVCGEAGDPFCGINGGSGFCDIDPRVKDFIRILREVGIEYKILSPDHIRMFFQGRHSIDIWPTTGASIDLCTHVKLLLPVHNEDALKRILFTNYASLHRRYEHEQYP